MKKIISVVGARPNFMKVAPLYRAFKKYPDKIQHLVCHTGQHYDEKMSKIFFDELEMPKPDFYLGIGSGTHAEQIAGVMVAFEKVLQNEKPDLVLVVGDVNSTIACSLVASRFNIKVAHVEAGLRSFDRTMPEEINRILTDTIADYLFVTEQSGIDNLKQEGIPDGKIFFVGNVMIDSLVFYLSKIEKSDILRKLHCTKKDYILVTLHRPANVDTEEELKQLFEMLNRIADRRKIIFPIHPRTKNNLRKFHLINMVSDKIFLTEPLGYIEFISLIKNSLMIVTDSGGIQEESTYLQVPCITVRNNTERPVTVTVGTNRLIGTDTSKVELAVEEVLNGKIKKGNIPELWDGRAAERICKIIVEKLNE
ncbi:MAG: UDP-N-acetylglucosamine 2-epimerase (non-hydrolyzing) [Chitinophagaceae bacterium]|nr:MAG: UDP-N-acetylglucosamine 2-epimerase (non-hydrolyzing) [Chitinophagaceae bacterium]